MDALFKKVFDSLSKLSSDQLREKLDEAADHPLVKVYEAFAEGYELGVLWSIEDAFTKLEIASQLLAPTLSYHDLVKFEEWCAANDDTFALAA
jgi:hypothetical protein